MQCHANWSVCLSQCTGNVRIQALCAKLSSKHFDTNMVDKCVKQQHISCCGGAPPSATLQEGRHIYQQIITHSSTASSTSSQLNQTIDSLIDFSHKLTPNLVPFSTCRSICFWITLGSQGVGRASSMIRLIRFFPYFISYSIRYPS